jgi:hypothetical protein
MAIAVLLVAFFLPVASAAGSGYPPCPSAVGGQTLQGTSNVGTPGVWVQGDPSTGAEVSCEYHPPGGGPQEEVHYAWVTPKNDGHAFYGCGATPVDDTTTFVSKDYEAYAGINVDDAGGNFSAAAKSMLAQLEQGYAKPCAKPKQTLRVWRWSFSLAAEPAKITPARAGHGLLGTRGHGAGTAVTADAADTTSSDSPAFSAKRSNHPAIGLTDLYLRARNRVTVLEVRDVRQVVSVQRGWMVNLDVAVRHSTLAGCAAGTSGALQIFDARGHDLDKVRLQLCGVERIYASGRPDASDDVSVRVSSTLARGRR